jgi:hypothetical protein
MPVSLLPQLALRTMHVSCCLLHKVLQHTPHNPPDGGELLIVQVQHNEALGGVTHWAVVAPVRQDVLSHHVAMLLHASARDTH